MINDNKIEEFMKTIGDIYQLESGEYFAIKLNEIKKDMDTMSKTSNDPIFSSVSKLGEYFLETFMDHSGDEMYTYDDIRRFLNLKKGGLSHDKRHAIASEMGILLKDDELVYIDSITNELLEHYLNKCSNVKGYLQPMDSLNGIISSFRDILFSVIESDSFNYIPNSKKMDGFEFYGKWILELERGIYSYALHDSVLLDKLLNILKEIEIYIRSYSVPGVVKRWRELNPKIEYFDAGYSFMDEERGLYERVKNGEFGGVKFAVYPTDEQLKERNKYFEDIEKFNKSNNLKYNDVRIFADELVNSLLVVTKHDLKEYM